MIQAFEPGKLYRITRGNWQNTSTLEFLRIDGRSRLVFAIPNIQKRISKNFRFEWYIKRNEILHARELTREEVLKLEESTP